jgi:AraC family transcriptional regulator, regulatory protein of adaptative response / methylated-DNA-[protein]-cysteine methyltransferase
MPTLPTETTMRRAFARKDSAYDGVFFVGVKTTGIFCRPVCTAKTPKPMNMEFFASTHDALYHGYRPCKRCRPLDLGSKPPPMVARLMELIERDPTRRLKESDLRAVGIEPSTARRQFQSYCDMTFHAYQRARRMGLALERVRQGEDIMQVQVESGFESASGFRDAFAKLFGAVPSEARLMAVLTSQWIETPLGPMLAVANEEGLCLLDFVDRRGLENAIKRLGTRFSSAIVPGENILLSAAKKQLQEYFSGKRREFSLSLSTAGTPFQTRAWEFLRTIPFGQTRTYGEMAKALGAAAAVRAVGRANGMNYLSIVIPCHRVIGADGSLTGYGGGLGRKRWLLDHERSVALGQRTIDLTSVARSSAVRAANV